MKHSKTKAAIIGCGRVGSTIAYTLALNYTVEEIVLIDQNEEAAKGNATDISHALANVSATTIYQGDYEDIKDSDIIIISVGVARKPGQSRLDLISQNAVIGKSVANSIKKWYNGGAVLVIFNPADVMTYMMDKWLDLPTGRVFGSGTVLDTARMNAEISRLYNADVRNIHSCVWGEHGDGSVPIWSLTNIGGINIKDYSRLCGVDFEGHARIELEQAVKTAGSRIIAQKGATCYGIAGAVMNITQAILRDSNMIMPLTVKCLGEYGIEGTALSILVEVGKDGISQRYTPPINEQELSEMQNSGRKLREIIEQVEKIV
ncbi:MAG: NAD-binding protein [Christensenella sp.]